MALTARRRIARYATTAPPTAVLALLLGLLTASPAGAQVKALRVGAMVDPSGRLTPQAIILISGDRIQQVLSGSASPPEGAEIVDLSKYTAIPGLIDVHTHMTYYWDGAPGTRPLAQPPRHVAVTVYLAQENARRTLETGVTTVRDLGASEYADLAMRDLINRGAMVGPRMFVAGHGLHVSRGLVRPGVQAPDPGLADGVEAVMRAARQQLGAGADVVKMYASTGSYQDVTGFQTFTAEEMKAAVDVTHALGRRIAIHSYGPSGARDAVRAGTDSLEHATDLDDETIREMATRGTYYVPTIDHNRFYAESSAQFGFSQAAVDDLKAFIGRNLATARRAVQAGVRLAMGSDAVYSMFGQNTRELEWFVRAGLTPAAALATATTQAAALLGKERELGLIAPGAYADVVAVEGNPLDDVHAVTDRVRWVMKGGQVVIDKRR